MRRGRGAHYAAPIDNKVLSECERLRVDIKALEREKVAVASERDALLLKMGMPSASSFLSSLTRRTQAWAARSRRQKWILEYDLSKLLFSHGSVCSALLLRTQLGGATTAHLQVRELEDEMHKLQGQLAEAYKKNSDNAEKMLAALSGQRDAETKVSICVVVLLSCHVVCWLRAVRCRTGRAKGAGSALLAGAVEREQRTRGTPTARSGLVFVFCVSHIFIVVSGVG
jgi:hypothetical protein